MTERTKNYLGISAIIGILVLAYAAWVAARAYKESIHPSSFRSFSVSAEGKALSIPDVALVQFSVITEGGRDIASLQKENSDKMNSALAFLKENGIAEKDIKTASYNIDPRYETYLCPKKEACPPPKITGYTIRQSVEVKIRDFSKISTVLEGVVKKGANIVSDFRFTLDDPMRLESLARAEALKKARLKAEEIAKAGGFRLGRALSIFEGGAYPFGGYGGEKALALDALALPSSPVVSPGEAETKISVTVTYEIR